MDQPSSAEGAPLAGARAMRGGRDLTKGPIRSTLWMFALPVLGSNVLQSLNASVNAIWVSHLLGETGLTATANANLILFFLLSVVFGTTMAASLLVAQAVGAGDQVLVKRSVGASLAFFSILAVTVAVLGFFFTPTILDAMQTPIDAKAEANLYLRVVFLATPFMVLFVFAQMVQRGSGDARTPLYFSILGVGLDIVFNPLLISGYGPFPELGIAGSALSTMLSQMIAFALLIAYLYRRKSPLALFGAEWKLFKLDPEIVGSLVTRGLPMGAQMLVISGAAIVMMTVVNRFGVQTSAAYGGASVIWGYVQMPAMAVGASVSAMAAQNVGARRWDRVDLIAREGVLFAVATTGVPIVAILLLNRQIMGLFLPAGGAALAIAEHLNHVALWSFAFFAVTFTYSGVVRATGAVMAPLVIVAVTMWLLRVPLAALASDHYGADAIWWSFPVSSIASAILAWLYYRYGGWRRKRLAPAAPDYDAS
jgi:putative MATE family efflux protein